LLLHYLAFVPLTTVKLDLFPMSGFKPLDIRYLVLPALTLGFSGAAYYVRLTRATMLDELHRDYVRTARSKGVGERGVQWRHAFRNALGPIFTQVGLDLGFFLGGVVVVESVFSWPGIGKLAFDSIRTVDVPLILGTVVLGSNRGRGPSGMVDPLGRSCRCTPGSQRPARAAGATISGSGFSLVRLDTSCARPGPRQRTSDRPSDAGLCGRGPADGARER